MSVSIWIFLVLMLFLIFWTQKQELNTILCLRIMRRKRGNEKGSLTAMFEQYVGKEGQIYTMNSQQRSGTILSIENGWITLQSASGTEVVNLDFVLRIREFPRNKRGKKKAVVLD